MLLALTLTLAGLVGSPGETAPHPLSPLLRTGVRIIAAAPGLTPSGVRAYFPDPRWRDPDKDDRREAYLPTQSNPSPPQAWLPCSDEDQGWPEDARPSSQ